MLIACAIPQPTVLLDAAPERESSVSFLFNPWAVAHNVLRIFGGIPKQYNRVSLRRYANRYAPFCSLDFSSDQLRVFPDFFTVDYPERLATSHRPEDQR